MVTFRSITKSMIGSADTVGTDLVSFTGLCGLLLVHVDGLHGHILLEIKTLYLRRELKLCAQVPLPCTTTKWHRGGYSCWYSVASQSQYCALSASHAVLREAVKPIRRC